MNSTKSIVIREATEPDIHTIIDFQMMMALETEGIPLTSLC